MEPITKEWIGQNVLVKSKDDTLEHYIRENMKPDYTEIVHALQTHLRKQSFLVEGDSFYIDIEFDFNEIEDALGKSLRTAKVEETYWKVYKDWFATNLPCVTHIGVGINYMMIFFKV